jgi:predicted TIM-barrel fold metal-dependent hydrolase
MQSMLEDSSFRAGFAGLAKLSLTFDAWLYFHQIPSLTALAKAFPGTGIVANHCGGVLGVGRYAAKRNEVRERWAANMRVLSECPNVYVKLGGLGMPIAGLGFDRDATVADSAALARAWTPWIDPLIEWFGAGRCMFESNFPADKISYGYVAGWNAMKRIAASASKTEKADLFWGTASRFYRLVGEHSRDCDDNGA